MPFLLSFLFFNTRMRLIIYPNSNYDCDGDEDLDRFLAIADGANNLVSIDWGTKIHGLRCRNWDGGDD